MLIDVKEYSVWWLYTCDNCEYRLPSRGELLVHKVRTLSGPVTGTIQYHHRKQVCSWQGRVLSLLSVSTELIYFQWPLETNTMQTNSAEQWLGFYYRTWEQHRLLSNVGYLHTWLYKDYSGNNKQSIIMLKQSGLKRNMMRSLKILESPIRVLNYLCLIFE